MPADLVIMALGNKSNPIIPEAEPDLKLSKWGTIEVEDGQETSIKDVYTGGDAARGGSTAILAAGDGQAAARQIVGDTVSVRVEPLARKRGSWCRTRRYWSMERS